MDGGEEEEEEEEEEDSEIYEIVEVVRSSFVRSRFTGFSSGREFNDRESQN